MADLPFQGLVATIFLETGVGPKDPSALWFDQVDHEGKVLKDSLKALFRQPEGGDVPYQKEGPFFLVLTQGDEAKLPPFLFLLPFKDHVFPGLLRQGLIKPFFYLFKKGPFFRSYQGEPFEVSSSQGTLEPEKLLCPLVGQEQASVRVHEDHGVGDVIQKPPEGQKYFPVLLLLLLVGEGQGEGLSQFLEDQEVVSFGGRGAEVKKEGPLPPGILKHRKKQVKILHLKAQRLKFLGIKAYTFSLG